MTWCAPVFEEPEYKKILTFLQTLPRRTELKGKSDIWAAFQALLSAASLSVFCSPACKEWVALFRQGGDSSRKTKSRKDKFGCRTSAPPDKCGAGYSRSPQQFC